MRGGRRDNPRKKGDLQMTHIERHLRFHLTVLTVLAALVVAAFVLEGVGLALIVALLGVTLLALGLPFGVIIEEERELPFRLNRR